MLDQMSVVACARGALSTRNSSRVLRHTRVANWAALLNALCAQAFVLGADTGTRVFELVLLATMPILLFSLSVTPHLECIGCPRTKRPVLFARHMQTAGTANVPTGCLVSVRLARVARRVSVHRDVFIQA